MESSWVAREPAGIRAVILDFGEVLSHVPATETIERVAGIFGMDAATFFAIYLQNRGAYDRGDVQAGEYWEGFAAQAGVKIDAQAIERARLLDLELWSRMNEAMVEWIERIHAAGFKTAVLSNMPADMAAHMRRTCAWIGHFDEHIFSGEVRRIKPEPAIYRHCLEALGVQAAEAVFIDDRDVNVAEARAAGMRAIRFQSVAQLRGELEALGFTILPR
ncbi:MAG: HAD family phosphatase [Candidatus Acidiferrales bacterium]